MDRAEIIEAVAFSIYMSFTRQADPAFAERRWNRIPEQTKENWRREAEAAISTYERLRGSP